MELQVANSSEKMKQNKAKQRISWLASCGVYALIHVSWLTTYQFTELWRLKDTEVSRRLWARYDYALQV